MKRNASEFATILRRKSVKEWRITTTGLGKTVRYWVEADPAFGGIQDYAEAIQKVQAAEDWIARAAGIWESENIAAALMEVLPEVNSIEVTTSGQGVCIHRDWP